MKKAPAKKSAKGNLSDADTSNLDLDPDAWPKFEKLVKSAAKMGPKPYSKPPKS